MKMSEHFPIHSVRPALPLISNPEKDNTRKGDCKLRFLMKIDAKILNKLLVNNVQ